MEISAFDDAAIVNVPMVEVLVQEEVKDDASSVSGSHVSEGTTKTKSGGAAFNKHCMLGTCDGKLIPGAHYARHLKTDAHKNHDGTATGAYVKCVGDGCDACIKGKYSSPFGTTHRLVPHRLVPLTV